MKNKHNLQRFIGFLIAAVGIVLGVIAVTKVKENEGLATTLFIIGLPFLVVGGIWYFVATSNSRGVCDACGQKMTGCEYQYQEVRRRYSNTGDGGTVTVEIIAHCPYCGQEKKFRKDFHINSNGGDNIQYQVDDFCRRHFGH